MRVREAGNCYIFIISIGFGLGRVTRRINQNLFHVEKSQPLTKPNPTTCCPTDPNFKLVAALQVGFGLTRPSCTPTCTTSQVMIYVNFELHIYLVRRFMLVLI